MAENLMVQRQSVPAAPTRRAFIGAAALAIPLAASSTAPIASGSRRQWDRLVSEYLRADAHMKAVGVEHAAAEDAFHIAQKAFGERPKPPFVLYPRPIAQMTVGELRDIAVPTHEQEQHAAALSSWQAQVDELERREYSPVEERWEAAVSQQEKAVQAIFAHPTPDAAALLFKLDLAEREYHGFDLDSAVSKQLFADMRRLLRGEA